MLRSEFTVAILEKKRDLKKKLIKIYGRSKE